MKLSVLTYLWHAPLKHERKKAYDADDVRMLQRQAARNLAASHQFACVTDRPELFDGDDDIVAVPIDTRIHIPGTCYAKLFPFSHRAQEFLGDYVLAIDLDSIIVGDITPLLRWNEDIILWRNPLHYWKSEALGCLSNIVDNPYCEYNASVVFHRCGSMCEVYHEFNPAAPQARDDQWYLSDIFAGICPEYTDNDGIYRTFRKNMTGPSVWGELPENARIITFPGDAAKPWNEATIRENPWILRHRN